MTFPKVNIIIVTWNQFKYVEQCIKSLLNCNYSNLSICIVDNNSDKIDFNKFYIKYKDNKKITFYRMKKNLGFAGGCNYAINKIKSGYIVLLNDDVIVKKNWLNPIIQYMEKNPDVGAVQPKIKDMKSKSFFQHAGAAGGFMDVFGYPFCRGRIFFNVEKDFGQYDDIVDVIWCSGTCFATKKNVIDKVGLLDTIFFMYAEEADLCWRMHNAGYRLVYLPNSTIYHIGSASSDRIPYKKVFFHHRNGIIMLIKNYKMKQLLLYLPFRIFLDIVTFWYYLLFNKEIKNALALILAYAHVLYILPTLVKIRSKNLAFKSKAKGEYKLYKRSIVLDYFLFKKRKFSDLPIRYL